MALSPKNAPVLLCLALVLSGCASEGGGGGTDDTGDTPPVDATPTTGGIRGVVVDERIVPIAGVLLEVRTTGKNVTTGEDGLFVFSGLQPGTYVIEARHGLYDTVQQTAEVVAGESNPKPLRVLLPRVILLDPYKTTEKFEGFIVCSAGHPEVGYSEECGEGLGVPGVGRVGKQGNNRVQYDFTVDNDVISTIQVEMAWQPTAQTAASGELLTYVSTEWACDPFCEGNTFVRGGSGSPMLLRADASVAADGTRTVSNTTACDCSDVKGITPDTVISMFTWANPNVFDPVTGEVPLGSVVYNQAYEAYITKSYALPLPADWSFVAGHPDPFA